MSNQRILRIGIAPRDYVKKRTIDIAKGRALAPGEPRHWVSSFESLAKVLSDRNMILLEMIRTSKPQSLTELAALSGRAKSNLSRTLHSMESLGVIELRTNSEGKKIPVVLCDAVDLTYPLKPQVRNKSKAA